jgi:phage terminase large subunit-like protein
MTLTAPARLPEWVLQLDREQLVALKQQLPPHLQDALDTRLIEVAGEPEPWEPHPHQTIPWDEDWFGFLLMGGRGAGKTAAVTHAMDEHANGPPCLRGKVAHRMGIIAPTVGDASASIVNGEDGLTVINPLVREVTRKGSTLAVWPNGAEAYLFGVNTRNDVDRLRAKGNRCFDVREEIAAWRWLKDGMAQADLGLRLGLARWVGATTPRPRPTIRKLDVNPIVLKSRATTDDNPDLSPEVRQRLYDEYGNTRLGLQELKGLILDEVTGALWGQELIEQYRVQADQVPPLVRVRTYVDPSWGTTNDECGIVVCGLGINRHVYVLADLSKRLTPLEWGILAVLGYLPAADERVGAEPREFYGYKAGVPIGRRSERVVGEGNFQGEQVRLNMKLVSVQIGRRVPFSLVTASKGKRLRAEPVHLAHEQGRVHIVGSMPGLEFQLTNWVPPSPSDHGDERDSGDPDIPEGSDEESEWSPDRLDAFVFGVTDLILGRGASVGKVEVADGRVEKQKTEPSGSTGLGVKIGQIPVATRQGRLAAEQLKGKRHS